MKQRDSCSTRMNFRGLSTIWRTGSTRNSGIRVQPDLIELTGCDIVIRFRQPVTSTDMRSAADNTKKTVKKINSSIEKTTLGDLDALAALKNQLENK